MENRYTVADYLKREAVLLQISRNTSDVPPHRHEFIELIYLWKGSAEHFSERRTDRLTEGDYLFVDCEKLHHFTEKSEDFCLLQCLFVPRFVDSSLKNCRAVSDILKSPSVGLYAADYAGNIFHDRDSLVRREFECMFEEFSSCRAGYKNMIRCCLLKILLHSARRLETDLYGGDPILAHILEHTGEHLDRNDNLTVLSEQLHYSPSRLSTLFKRGTGITYTEYLRRLRIGESTRLLTDTALSVEKIAESVGYSDVRAYRKYFKGETGISPLQYRIRERKKGKTVSNHTK